jgi:hypothetical protein
MGKKVSLFIVHRPENKLNNIYATSCELLDTQNLLSPKAHNQTAALITKLGPDKHSCTKTHNNDTINNRFSTYYV